MPQLPDLEGVGTDLGTDEGQLLNADRDHNTRSKLVPTGQLFHCSLAPH